MKTIIFVLLSCIFADALAQEAPQKTIKSTISDVTVFIEGAQVTRKKQIELTSGKTLIRFVDLSPFIDEKSIQIKAEGNLVVLSVTHQQNFTDKPAKSAEMLGLESQLKEIEDKINLGNTYLAILNEELAFLQANRDIGGKNQALNVTSLQEASDFYRTRLTALKLKGIEREKTLTDLKKQKADIENQSLVLAANKEFPSGEILVTVDAKTNTSASFEISYLVGNCGWFPSYDIRSNSITEPVELVYKANVRQDTKVDWNNVKLSFSSSDPNVSGRAPELRTYFLDYNTPPPVYRNIQMVSGRVLDSNNDPLPGTTVTIQGTTIGTVTDTEGRYMLSIPANAGYVTFSFIGFKEKTVPISGQIMNITMEEETLRLDEVVVVGYGVQKKSMITGRNTGVATQNLQPVPKVREATTLPVPSVQVEKQTSVSFEIKAPYTIRSDNKSFAVDMEVYRIPAVYQYFSVPKIDKDAFLIAGIPEYEQYNLLEGEANVFFEGTFVGKILVDVRSASDTLQLSFGRDKNVSVSREKVKDYKTKQSIGNKKEESREWQLSVKNNKKQDINIVLLDQVPVSTSEEIEVEVQQISGAKRNNETGELKWEFTLSPSAKKDLELKYTVQYPKTKTLIVE
jgi:hypothetical protein